MPTYSKVKRNERADLAAKKATKDRVNLHGSSLIYIKKKDTYRRRIQKEEMIKRNTPKKTGKVWGPVLTK